MNRDKKIDIIKGITILLMVLGHTNFAGRHFIYMFHMAVFFMASGYFVKDKNSETIAGVKTTIIKRIKGLWLPYFIWNTIYTLCNNLFIQTNIYTVDEGVQAYLDPSLINIAHTMSIKEMGINIAKGLYMKGQTELGGAFWFLQILLYISIAYVLIDFCLKKILKFQNKVLIAQGIISAVFLTVGFLMSLKIIKPIFSERFFSYYHLYYLGMLLSKIKTANLKKLHYAVMTVLGCTVVIILSYFGSISLNSNDYVNPAFLIGTSLAGWFFLFGIAGLIENIKNITSVLIILGQNTMALVIFHSLCFKPINLTVSLIKGWPLSTVAGFPINLVEGCWWIAYAITGTVIPVAIWLIWKRIKKSILKK